MLLDLVKTGAQHFVNFRKLPGGGFHFNPPEHEFFAPEHRLKHRFFVTVNSKLKKKNKLRHGKNRLHAPKEAQILYKLDNKTHLK